jgi:hypothetical protein
MKMRVMAATVAAIWAMGAVAPASAQTVQAKDPKSVMDALASANYPSELKKDDGGDPLITSEANGMHFLIAFYGCKSNLNCTTVSFYSAFRADKKPTAATMNEWNSKKRFGRAFLDNEGDPAIQLDVDLDDGGMSRALFIDNIEWFSVAFASLREATK